MSQLLKKIINLILYSNLWIAIGAAAMALQTQWIISSRLYINKLIGLVFFSTLFLYALHRIVGITKQHEFVEEGRYKVIYQYRNHIIFYAIVAALGGAFCFFYLPWSIWLAILIPSFISLGYVLPVFGGKRRLRDFDQIKIYLIAVVWAWITVVLVAMEDGSDINFSIVLMTVERALFVLAITLPFDIRDLKVDAHAKVKTIPSTIGIPKTKILAYLLLGLVMLLVCINYQQGFYTGNNLIALLISSCTTAIMIAYSDKITHDYYFTGLLDGTMLIQFLLVYYVN